MSEAHFSKFYQVDAAESSILQELEDSTWGEVFNFQEILVLAKHMAAYRLPQGATLFKEGDRVPFLCLVYKGCLLYTSPSPRDQRGSRMPSSA